MHEKQPIDDLFGRKLRDAEVQPGPDTWARLQARRAVGTTEQSRKPLAMVNAGGPVLRTLNSRATRWVSAAACLLLLGFGGWYAWQESQPAHGPAVARQEKTHVDRPAYELAPNPAHQDEKELSNQAESLPEERIANNASQAVAVARRRERQKPVAPALTIEPVDTATPAPAHKEAESMVAQTLDVLLTRQSEPDKAILPPISKPATERGLVLTLAEPTPVAAQAPAYSVDEPTMAPSRAMVRKEGFGKLVQQMKRLKRGEALARNDETPPDVAIPDSRTKLGRVLGDVRASILSNESN